jgi:hypothetical protein
VLIKACGPHPQPESMMDSYEEDVSIVIKETDDDLMIRNQQLAYQVEEANEKIRALVSLLIVCCIPYSTHILFIGRTIE